MLKRIYFGRLITLYAYVPVEPKYPPKEQRHLHVPAARCWAWDPKGLGFQFVALHLRGAKV